LTRFLSSLDNFMDVSDSTMMGEQSPMQGPKISTVSVIGEADRPRTSYEVTFPSAILWALIGCASSFAVSIVTERTRGTMLRLRMAPIGRSHILAGKGLACFLTAISVSFVLLVFGKIVFGVRLSNPLMLAVAVGSAAFCFSGLMMLISVIGKTEQAVGGAGMAILLIMAMTGGGMIPLMFMPKWLTTVSNFSPVKWGILATEGAIWRGFTAGEMMMPVGVLLSIGVFAFGVGVYILSRSDV
jgi:ABC-2 type transport system permease protein